MLIFLDLETTGLEAEDKIVSIAIIVVDNGEVTSKYELVNEGKKIPPKASSIHHITNEMIYQKALLIDTEIWKFLNDNNTPDCVVVGHNVNFDIRKLNAVGFDYKGAVIDTLRVSKHLIPECESYGLQVLRYELKLYKSEKIKVMAHHALGDAEVLKYLYEYLLDLSSQEEMLNLSFKKVLLEKFGFGKYTGRYIEEISMCDRGYLEWMLSKMVDLDDDLRYSINYYLQG
ncbi:exonuclease domain-containing protein [Sulfurimonas sp.]|uniref:exonuclease domain-containing protein n=1 Tax=Sulfurimonas sp. TaxID=2022749 RepID=UPI0039E33784